MVPSREQPLTIAGDGSQFRKFIYVEDLAEGNVLALKPVGENKTYNLDGSEKVTIRQIAETIQKIIGNVGIEYVQGRPGDFSGKEISSERAHRDLKWKPKVSFEQGVAQYVEWYKERENQIRIEEERLDRTLRER